jgi:hypothetical protein
MNQSNKFLKGIIMKLNFAFTIDEANAILKALSQLPYEQVFGMIHSIQAQAAPQVEAIEAQAKASESTIAVEHPQDSPASVAN